MLGIIGIIDDRLPGAALMLLLSVPQIDFLNSVIVDLQRKNEDLKDKLEKMAAASLNGNNPSELDNYDG